MREGEKGMRDEGMLCRRDEEGGRGEGEGVGGEQGGGGGMMGNGIVTRDEV